MPRGQIQAASTIVVSQSKSEADSIEHDLTDITDLIRRVAERLIEAEVELNDLDAITGDGDCGSTTKLGANGMLPLH